MEYSVVGKRLPRIDATVKVTGEAKYTGDMSLPRMLQGKILRSPHPHARILNIDTSRAGRLVGVKAVITGKDTLGRKYGHMPKFADQTPLAMDKVRYVGDEVAAVAAVDEDVAEEALDLIHVDYEVLPAVFDPIEAMRPEAPKIHDTESNISVHIPMNCGNVEKGFTQSDYIREDHFETQSVTHCPLEAHSSLASFDPNGNLTIWACKQTPFFTARILARTLGMPESKVRLIKPYVGGGFGGKTEMISGDFCSALLSIKTGMPVKIVYTREEVFTSTRRRHPMMIELKTGVKKDGQIMAVQCKLIADGGAYNSTAPQAIFNAGCLLNLPFRIPNVKYDGYHVYTNKPICGAQRGHGTPQIRFAADCQMDIIAEKLGMDPIEFRLRNAVRPGEITANKLMVTSCGFSQCIEKAAEAVGWKEKKAKSKDGRGLGMGCSSLVSGINIGPHIGAGAIVKIHTDGAVTLFTGAADVGQGAETVMAQITAEELGICLEDIRVTAADTELTPFDPGCFSARTTFLSGNAVKAAAMHARQQLLGAAAEELESNPEDLELSNGRIYVKGSPEKGISFRDALKAYQKSGREMPIVGKGFYRIPAEIPNFQTGQGNVSAAYSFGAQVADVELDPDIGKIQIHEMVLAHDGGTSINPMSVEGQLEGSIAAGMGQALTENLIWDEGQALNPSLLDYKLITAIDIPQRVKAIPVETFDPEGPFGAKEAGEGTQISTAQSIANALHDASGVRIKNLPLSPEKILEALGKGMG